MGLHMGQNGILGYLGYFTWVTWLDYPSCPKDRDLNFSLKGIQRCGARTTASGRLFQPRVDDSVREEVGPD